eukprot:GFKZ01015814.1.p1 GENE.GFKZ01015814.1~~GFKZ01015814.1.p1  ORF type:complete len:184 (+),score=23.18 GFKZ01015814.1:461-1012(+)
MVELVSVRYSSLKESMHRHVYIIAALVEQLWAMGTTLDNPLVIGISIVLITVDELKPSSAAIKTLSDEKKEWVDVTSRLIEEVRTIKCDRVQSSRQATHDNRSCSIRSKNNHRTVSCYLKTFNKYNKLAVSESAVRYIADQNGSRTGHKQYKAPKKGRSTESGSGSSKRSAMAKINKTKVLTT